MPKTAGDWAILVFLGVLALSVLHGWVEKWLAHRAKVHGDTQGLVQWASGAEMRLRALEQRAAPRIHQGPEQPS